MRPRNTLLLLLVLAALGAYVYWVELPHEKREAEQKQLLAFEKDKVASITLDYPDHQIALARDADKHWRITKPIDAPADDAAASNLVTAVADAKVTRTLDDVGDKLASYGLEPPEAVVKLGLEGGTELPAIKVGKTTQVGFSAYVQKDDEKSVRIAGGALHTGLKKELKDLRDKNVLAFDEAQVKKVTLAKPDGTLTVERGDGDTWHITAPAAYPADPSEVRVLLSSIRGIRAEDFPTDAPDADLKTYGLDQPRLTVTVVAGKDEAQQTLLVGATHEEGQKKTVYMKRGERPTVYAVPEYAAKNVEKDLGTLRDKTVLAFDKNKAGKLVVTRKDGAGFTLVKRDGAWHVDSPAGEGTERAPAITRFLEDVAGLKGGTILDEHATDLGKYGLAKPDLMIAISDDSGAALGTILGARAAAPDDSRVTADGTSIVYGVKSYVYDRIDKKATDFRTPPPSPVPSGAAALATPAPGAGVLGGAGMPGQVEAPGDAEPPDDGDAGDEGGDADD